MECTKEEYAELQVQAAALTLEEAREELLECSRYGEVDAVRAIIHQFQKPQLPNNNNNNHKSKSHSRSKNKKKSSSQQASSNISVHVRNTLFINTSFDKQHNTALHKACANGHVSTASLLMDSHALHYPNESGNTPLHWAASGGHEECVKLLLARYSASSDSANGGNKKGGGGGGKNRNGKTKNKQNNNHNNNNNDSEKNVTPPPNIPSEEEVKNGTRIDVLLKNKFGRSSLTEGFSSQNTLVIGMLLEHETSTEERLIGGYENGDDEDNEDDNEGGSAEGEGEEGTKANTSKNNEKPRRQGVVHEFDFRQFTTVEDNTPQSTNSESPHEQKEKVHENNDQDCDSSSKIVEQEEKEEEAAVPDSCKDSPKSTFLVRELPIAHADNPFGDSAKEDTTGLGIWCASLVMARWMSSQEISSRFEKKAVLELGAGCGVPGLAAAHYSHAESVYITDLNPETVENIRFNISLNNNNNNNDQPSSVHALTMDWGDESTYPTEKIDYILGSDLIYQSDIVPLLKQVLVKLLKPNGGTFFYVAPHTQDIGRDGLEEFILEMKKGRDGDGEGGEGGFECVAEKIAPKEYRCNPLYSGDEEDCFLHFGELATTDYMLYEFRRL